MKHPADDWPKTLLNGVLVGSILFLTVLPSLGWAWHRVLPEHTHVFIGEAHSHVDEVLPAETVPDEAPSFCSGCSGTQIGAGIEHLPGNAGVQVLGIALELGMLMFVLRPPAFSDQVIKSRVFYRSPALLLLDPPPNRGELIV